VKPRDSVPAMSIEEEDEDDDVVELNNSNLVHHDQIQIE
jgi:hypothetical protein